MKFDPYSWHEFKPNLENHFGSGRLRVKASAPVAWFVTCQGVETLAGFSADLDVTLAERGTVRADTPLKGVRCFLYEPMPQSFVPVGPKFTNADRRPNESGSVLAVKQAMREMQLQQREYRREQAAMIAEHRKIYRSNWSDTVEADESSEVQEVEEEGVQAVNDD